ncbi:MAG: hypothetical protein AAGJ08_00185 [Cyanobacteria bacterium P01_H01_bin.35]
MTTTPNSTSLCFTGTRVVGAEQRKYFTDKLSKIIFSFLSVPGTTLSTHVGDARGIDTIVYNYLMSLSSENLSVQRHIVEDKTKVYSYAQRSMKMVDAVASSDANRMRIIAVPNKPCPPEITVENPFCGSKSGTWATISLRLTS